MKAGHMVSHNPHSVQASRLSSCTRSVSSQGAQPSRVYWRRTVSIGRWWYRPGEVKAEKPSRRRNDQTKHRPSAAHPLLGHEDWSAYSKSTSAALGLPVLRGTGTSVCIETCSQCGGEMKIIASIEDPTLIHKILAHLNNKSASTETPVLPACRTPPATGLFNWPNRPRHYTDLLLPAWYGMAFFAPSGSAWRETQMMEGRNQPCAI